MKRDTQKIYDFQPGDVQEEQPRRVQHGRAHALVVGKAVLQSQQQLFTCKIADDNLVAKGQHRQHIAKIQCALPQRCAQAAAVDQRNLRTVGAAILQHGIGCDQT